MEGSELSGRRADRPVELMRARVFEVERLEFLARSALLRLHDIFRNRIVCPVKPSPWIIAP